MAGKVAPALLGMEEIVAEEDCLKTGLTSEQPSSHQRSFVLKCFTKKLRGPRQPSVPLVPGRKEALFQQRLRESDRKILMNPVSKLIAKKKTAKNHPASSDFKLIFSLTNKYSLWVKATYVRLPGYIATAYPT